MTVVPAEWTRMVGTLRDARIAYDCAKAFETSPADRDLALTRYERLEKSIMADLFTLSDNRDLGRITLLLSKKERS